MPLVLEFKKQMIMNITEVAQWVIDNRYPKSEFEKLSDHELYHGLIEKIELVLSQNSGNAIVSGSGSDNIVAIVRHYCPHMLDDDSLNKDFNGDLLRAWKYITDDEHPAGYSDTWELVAVERY